MTPEYRRIADGIPGWLLRGQAQLLWVRPAVMVGQDLARLSGLVCDCALAHLAADNRQMGNSHREAPGRGGGAHQTP
jgi:hypothetical protein